MNIYTLRENVLTDNTLVLSSENKVFKGRYIAIINEYTYQNAWTDKMSVKRFRDQTRLEKYLSKNYPEFYISFYA
jgi:hypothetical protein